MFNAPMMNKSIDYSQHISPQVPSSLFADSIRIQQLLMNLLSNALKFTPEGGAISLSLDIEENPKSDGMFTLKLSVTDTGIGISEDRLNSIFDAYQQAETHTARIYGGTGLGLSLCRQISHLMGGRIEVESEVGQGSTFSVFVSAKNGADYSAEAEIIKEGAVIEHLVVMVAEDNPTNRKVIKMLLKKLGIEAIIVEDGQQLLNSVEGVSPDLILMDCHMPVMDGFEATKVLRERGMTMPIYALTAGVSTEERIECANIGMNEVLTKPVTLQSLKTALQRVIAN